MTATLYDGWASAFFASALGGIAPVRRRRSRINGRPRRGDEILGPVAIAELSNKVPNSFVSGFKSASYVGEPRAIAAQVVGRGRRRRGVLPYMQNATAPELQLHSSLFRGEHPARGPHPPSPSFPSTPDGHGHNGRRRRTQLANLPRAKQISRTSVFW